jgi:D-alanyl-D-alanine carboxypeptidase (penicillin-binding protein 5/6)
MAEKIGAYDTNFVNPHGLHHDEHYTTAYDLALITSYGLRNPKFETIVSAKYHTIPWEGHEWDRVMRNKNTLLWSYDGANGVKTGFTKKAGRCFVGSAKREGMQLVSVVLNCGPMFEESAALMDHGFANYRSVTVVEENQFIQSLPVIKGKQDEVELTAERGYSVALNDKEIEQLHVRRVLADELEAPVETGQWVGSLQIYLKDELLEEIPIVTGHAVEKRSIWDFFHRLVNIWR